MGGQSTNVGAGFRVKQMEFKFVGCLLLGMIMDLFLSFQVLLLCVKIKDNNSYVALAGVAQLVGHHPTDPKVMGSIPSQGTCLGCRFGPQLRVCPKRQ